MLTGSLWLRSVDFVLQLCGKVLLMRGMHPLSRRLVAADNRLASVVCALSGLPLALILSTSLAGSAQAENLEDVRRSIFVGIGYGFKENSTVLDAPLPLSNPDYPYLIALPEFPPECFSTPGITSVGPIEVDRQGAAMARIEALAVFGFPVEIGCGEKATKAIPIVQVGMDGQWKRFTSPAPDLVNGLFEEVALNILGNMEKDRAETTEFSTNPKGGIDIEGREKVSVGIRVDPRDNLYKVLVSGRYGVEEQRDDALEVLRRKGCQVMPLENAETGKFSALVISVPIDPSAVFSISRDMVRRAYTMKLLEMYLARFSLGQVESLQSGKPAQPFNPDQIASEMNDDLCSVF